MDWGAAAHIAVNLIFVGFGYLLGRSWQRDRDHDKEQRLISLLVQEQEITDEGAAMARHAIDRWH